MQLQHLKRVTQLDYDSNIGKKSGYRILSYHDSPSPLLTDRSVNIELW